MEILQRSDQSTAEPKPIYSNVVSRRQQLKLRAFGDEVKMGVQLQVEATSCLSWPYRGLYLLRSHLLALVENFHQASKASNALSTLSVNPTFYRFFTLSVFHLSLKSNCVSCVFYRPIRVYVRTKSRKSSSSQIFSIPNFNFCSCHKLGWDGRRSTMRNGTSCMGIPQ